MRHQRLFALIPALLLSAAPVVSSAGIGIAVSVNIAPPPLPVYVQPPLPAPGYIWTPGYWAWDGMDYYWVPGTWVMPPVSGMLWTPGYWAWRDGIYAWNEGYWGPEVGFYGGVNYGFGYNGEGFHGGYWHGGAFFYNRAVANFGHVNVVNVYTTPVEVHERSHVSFNGGEGGLRWRPSQTERVAMSERHGPLTGPQREHEEHAAAMPAMHMGQNHGRPQILTTQRAADFAHPGPGLHNHASPQHQESFNAGHPVEQGAQPMIHGAAPTIPGASPRMYEGQSPQIAHPGGQVEHHGAPAGGGFEHHQGAGAQQFNGGSGQPTHEQGHPQGPRDQGPHEQPQHEQGGHHEHEHDH